MKRALVIDDSLFWRELVGNIAKQEGYEVYKAEDGLEGYNMAFEVMPNVIFTDIEMPKMKGHTLCRLLKNIEAFKNVGIIIMTSLDETINRFWASTAGADGFLQKGISPTKFEEDIRKFLKKNFYFNLEEFDAKKPQKFEEITYLLEDIILKETIKNEVYALYRYISDEEHVFWRLADLLFQIVPTRYVNIMTLDPQEGRLFISSKDQKLNAEKIKKVLFSVFSRPVVPVEWKIMGDGLGGDYIPKLVPFVFRDKAGKEVGVLGIEEGLSSTDIEIVSDVVTNLGELFKLTMSYTSAVRQARYDELTGLLNFRALMEKLTEYFSISRRSKSPLSLGIIDIDDFKTVNDTYGHLIGNEVLRELACLMRVSFRKVDIIGRYGGEEFVIAMANTPLENAKAAFERFRKKVEEHNWGKIVDNLRITVSAGLASTQDGKKYRTVVEMIEDADKALYEAKELGKNQVVTAK